MQCASSGATPVVCETRASARNCTSLIAPRRDHASPAQAALCPPDFQCATWHDREQQRSEWQRAQRKFASV